MSTFVNDSFVENNGPDVFTPTNGPSAFPSGDAFNNEAFGTDIYKELKQLQDAVAILQSTLTRHENTTANENVHQEQAYAYSKTETDALLNNKQNLVNGAASTAVNANFPINSLVTTDETGKLQAVNYNAQATIAEISHLRTDISILVETLKDIHDTTNDVLVANNGHGGASSRVNLDGIKNTDITIQSIRGMLAVIENLSGAVAGINDNLYHLTAGANKTVISNAQWLTEIEGNLSVLKDLYASWFNTKQINFKFEESISDYRTINNEKIFLLGRLDSTWNENTYVDDLHKNKAATVYVKSISQLFFDAVLDITITTAENQPITGTITANVTINKTQDINLSYLKFHLITISNSTGIPVIAIGVSYGSSNLEHSLQLMSAGVNYKAYKQSDVLPLFDTVITQITLPGNKKSAFLTNDFVIDNVIDFENRPTYQGSGLINEADTHKLLPIGTMINYYIGNSHTEYNKPVKDGWYKCNGDYIVNLVHSDNTHLSADEQNALANALPASENIKLPVADNMLILGYYPIGD